MTGARLIPFYRSPGHEASCKRRIRNQRLLIILRLKWYWEAEWAKTRARLDESFRQATVAFKEFQLVLPPELIEELREDEDEDEEERESSK